MAAVLGVRKTLINRREATFTALQTELITGEKKRPVYRQMIQQAATLKAWSAEERDWLDHYAYLSAVLPRSEEIYLTSVAFGPNRAIRLGVKPATARSSARWTDCSVLLAMMSNLWP